MPYDAMNHQEPLDASVDSFPGVSQTTQIRGDSGILFAMREAGLALVASAKRTGARWALSAMMVAGVVLGVAQAAEAQTLYAVGGCALQGIDTATNAVLFNLPNESDVPFGPVVCANPYDQQLAISSDGNSLYVPGISAPDGSTNPGIYIFDLQTETFSTPISLGNVWPSGPIQITPDGKSLYVETMPVGTLSDTPTGIAVLDTSTNQVTLQISLPFPTYSNSSETCSAGISFTPDTQHIYAINAPSPPAIPGTQIAEIDTATGAVISTFSLNYTYTDPQGVQHNATWGACRIGFTPDGGSAYIEGRGTYTFNGNTLGDPTTVLLVMNTATNSTIATISSLYNGAYLRDDLEGPIVCGLAGFCYVTDSELSGTSGVSVIDVSTNEITAAFNIGFNSPLAIVLTPDGQHLYIANNFPGLLEINTATNQVIARSIGDEVYIIGLAITPTSASTSSPINPKTLGNASDIPCGCDLVTGLPVTQTGKPITIGTGNMFEHAADYSTAGANPLSFTRYYNSQGKAANTSTYATTLGVNWRSTYDRYLHISPATGAATSVMAERADGQVLNFTLSGGVWTSDSDVDIQLTQSGSTWTLTDHNDNVETYTATGNEGTLNSITARDGYAQTLSYSGGLLSSVTDSYNRSLKFTYSATGLLQTLSTPDNLTFTYGFTPVTGGNVLTTVGYSTTPATNITYQYGNASFPFALTGVIDEDGQQFLSWNYDANGWGISSQSGIGAGFTTLAYNSNGTTTVTNAFGVADTYTFQTLQGVPKVTQISRAATSTTAAATRAFTYDTNGYLASASDWNGDLTTYVNDVHGDPTTINEAVGSPVARTTTITYDSTFVHLPDSIVTPGLTTNFTYDTSGNLLTRTLSDTTTTTAPYSTNGQSRTWTNTWSNALLASTQGPRTDVTQTTKFGYDASGALTSVTDALGHVTKITAHTGGGLPQTIVDPNGVTTQLAYDARQRLLSSTVVTAAGSLTTGYSYDAAGNLTKITLPDGSFLANTYDAAHRLTSTADALGEDVNYTLDALGDRTQINILNGSSTVVRQHSAVFDALGRVLNDIGGVGQTTAYAYDTNGNPLTVTDPLSRVTQQAFDALNRLNEIINAAKGVTTASYDAHNRLTSLSDPNSNATSYIRDGFGDIIQQTSPDSGVAVYLYDSAT